jgi:iron complex outermembrane receptor protein
MNTRARRVNGNAGRRIVTAVAALLSAPAIAGESGASAGRSLADLSIEELMNESVTSVSRREESLADAAAAVAVISSDDLRRSGATSIVDALRLVPGVDVGALNASQYAVSARGFNHLYSNKLLVLVDGRAVYSPLFAGVHWDMQQPLLEDVDRIEVIRGPGATLWGANAVNGVINIITRSAQDTRGGVWFTGSGNVQRFLAGARYGAQLSPQTAWRVFAGTQSTGDFYTSHGAPAGDGWHGAHAGMRLDSEIDDRTQLMWQADGSNVALDGDASNGYEVSTLARWHRRYSTHSSFEIQAYYDRTYRSEITRARYALDTFDLSLQQAFMIGARNAVVWGVGYRFVSNYAAQTTPLVSVLTPRFDSHLASLFVQDEIEAVPGRVFVTIGSKLEHNDFTGLEVQPNLRLRVKPSERQTLWAAESRAVRTPDEVESKDVFGVPVAAPVTGPDGQLYVPTLLGNARPVSEVLHAREVGYRIQASPRLSVDVAAFYNRYRDLISYGPVTSFIPGSPTGIATLPLMNLLSARTHGMELSVTAAPADQWRLVATYALLRGTARGPAIVGQNLSIDGPQHQATLRSYHDFSSRGTLTLQTRYVDSIPGARSYVTADAQLAYRAGAGVELTLAGQNLFDRRHTEQGSAFLETTADVPRSVYVKIAQRF